MIVKRFRVSIFPPKTAITDVIANNGIVLDSILETATTEEECSITGDYTLDATFTNDKKLSKHIKEDCILKVLEDYGYEIFRIKKCEPSLRKITIMAKQYTITEQQQIWLDDVRPTNLTGQSALNYMMNNATGVKDLNIYSDITASYTGYYQLMDFYKACFDCDQSFASRWGANGLETMRRQNNIYFNQKRGLKKQLAIREGKNLTGFTGSANTDSYITRAIGQGYNGIKGHYIESPKINEYSRVHTQVIKYEDVKVRTSDMTADTDGVIFDTLTEAQAELDRRIQLEFSQNHIDDINATYSIDFIQLEKTEEYKNYSFLEKADVGDYVKVNIASMDIDIVVRVMKKKYDNVRQKCIGMTLSNVPIQASVSTASIINGLKAEYQKSNNYNIGAYVASMLQAGLQDSYVTVKNNEILIMDTKDINTAKNVWRWNKGALAHTNKGYYAGDDDWNIGITQDGRINAEMILTGILTAITIKNKDGSFMIDLSQSGGCKFLSNNVLAMEILKNGLNFYGSDSNKFGVIGTYKTWDGIERLGLNHERGKQLCIGYNTDYGFYPYVRFDITKSDGRKPVYFSSDSEFSNAFINYGRVLSNLFFGNNEGNISLASNTEGSGIVCSGAFGVVGNLNVTGDKNCIQQTSEGNIRFSAIEDYNALLTYTSIDDVYKTTQDGDIYSCKIDINKIGIAINECLNTEMPYVVEIHPEDDNTDNFAMYKVKREKDYFIVRSNVPMSFKFTLKARRKGFESRNISNEKKKIYLDILLEDTEYYYNALWEKCGQEWFEYGICIDD